MRVLVVSLFFIVTAVSWPADSGKLFIEATVTNGSGKAIRGLTRDDFRVFDGGRAQELIACEPPAGWNIVLAVDTVSMRVVGDPAFWKDVKKALFSLGRNDRVAVLRLAYGDLQWRHDFTSDPKPIVAILYEDKPLLLPAGSGSTKRPLYDAVAEAAHRFPPSDARISRAIFVLSKDPQIRSQIKPDAATEEALKARVSVYQVVLDGTGGYGVIGPWPVPQIEVHLPKPQDPGSVLSLGMASVVRRTGGDQMALSASTKAVSTLLARLRQQYVLSYQRPASNPGEFRTVLLELTAAARHRYPDAVVRARSGYYAAE